MLIENSVRIYKKKSKSYGPMKDNAGTNSERIPIKKARIISKRITERLSKDNAR